jgi:protein-S-isoprenylcysteine O-methyltransferase Ste14
LYGGVVEIEEDARAGYWTMMNVWYAKAVVLAAGVVMIAIRAPHGQRSRKHKVVKSGKGPLEIVLLTLAWIGFFLPIIWVASDVFAFAEYPLHPIPLVAGVVVMTLGLWLFYHSHADLGANWSITLEVRENHQLVRQGVYRSIRHPMYSSFLLYSFGQALVVPNWIAGPSYFVAMAVLIALRLGPEEHMMLGTFGADYEAYRATTKRLAPGVW